MLETNSHYGSIHTKKEKKRMPSPGITRPSGVQLDREGKLCLLRAVVEEKEGKRVPTQDAEVYKAAPISGHKSATPGVFRGMSHTCREHHGNQKKNNTLGTQERNTTDMHIHINHPVT